MKTDRRLAVAIGLDVFVVVLFVAIGRRNHDEEPGIVGVLQTAAPFLIGLAVAWLIVRAWHRPTSILTGIAIWPITILVGMITRRVVFDEGTATSFVIVATLFLGACIVGWRAVYRLVDQRRRAATSRGSLLSK